MSGMHNRDCSWLYVKTTAQIEKARIKKSRADWMAANQARLNKEEQDMFFDVDWEEKPFTINMEKLPTVAEHFVEGLRYEEEKIRRLLDTGDE